MSNIFYFATAISVTVPEGVQPGQTLTVRSPDGSQSVRAIVPDGLTAGDGFLVRFPPLPATAEVRDGATSYRQDRSDPPFEGRGRSIDEILGSRAAPDPVADDALETREEDHDGEQEELIQDSPSLVDVLDNFFTPKPDVPKVEEKKVAEKKNAEESSQTSSAPRQKLLLVDVPPGIRPGSTIHVEIPGEFRTLAALVPPNVTSFHVAYTPQPVEVHSPSTPRYVPPTMRVAPPQQAQSTLVHHLQAAPGQKLLLVRVPPGTEGGTTLHVSVPDEPGRILAAKVPRGGVTEFHVSYEARPAIMQSRSMLPPANPYAQGNPAFEPY